MELVERYLNEIGRRLPKSKRDDIRDELRSALDDALESRAVGEPSEADIVAVIEEFGSPEAVVASYSGDRYLIGPRLYPQFKTALRIVVTVLASLVVLGFAVSLFDGNLGLAKLAEKLGGLVTGLLDSAVTSIGIVVIVFAILEKLEVGDEIREKRWNPRDLPAVRDVDLTKRFDSVAGIAFPAMILILINQFRDQIGVVVRSGTSVVFGVGARGGTLLLNDVFLDNLPWLNTSLLLSMGLSAWLLWSGRWHLSSRLVKIALDVFGLYVVYRICQGAIGARSELLNAGFPTRILELFVRGLELAPIVVAAVVVIHAGKHLHRAFKSSS